MIIVVKDYVIGEKIIHRRLYGKCVTIDRDYVVDQENNEEYIKTVYKCKDYVIIEKASDLFHTLYVIVKQLDATLVEKILNRIIDHIEKTKKKPHRAEVRVVNEKETLVI